MGGGKNQQRKVKILLRIAGSEPALRGGDDILPRPSRPVSEPGGGRLRSGSERAVACWLL